MPTNQPEIFINRPPDFSIDKDGIAHIRVVSGDQEINLRCTPHVLLAGSSAAMRAYVEWDARQRLEATPIQQEI